MARVKSIRPAGPVKVEYGLVALFEKKLLHQQRGTRMRAVDEVDETRCIVREGPDSLFEVFQFGVTDRGGRCVGGVTSTDKVIPANFVPRTFQYVQHGI